MTQNSTYKATYHQIYNKDGRFWTVLALILQYSLIIISLFTISFYVSVHQVENRYFPTTFDGRLVPNMALDVPNLSKASLTSWLAQSVTTALTFSYHDYRRRLRESSNAFTRQGWREFTEFIKDRKMIEQMQASRMVTSAFSASAPIGLSQGIFTDSEGRERYFWQMRFDVNLISQEAGSIDHQKLQIVMNIVRVPKLDNPNGVAIDSWRLI